MVSSHLPAVRAFKTISLLDGAAVTKRQALGGGCSGIVSKGRTHILHLRGAELMLQRSADQRCDLRRGYAQTRHVPGRFVCLQRQGFPLIGFHGERSFLNSFGDGFKAFWSQSGGQAGGDDMPHLIHLRVPVGELCGLLERKIMARPNRVHCADDPAGSNLLGHAFKSFIDDGLRWQALRLGVKQHLMRFGDLLRFKLILHHGPRHRDGPLGRQAGVNQTARALHDRRRGNAGKGLVHLVGAGNGSRQQQYPRCKNDFLNYCFHDKI